METLIISGILQLGLVAVWIIRALKKKGSKRRIGGFFQCKIFKTGFIVEDILEEKDKKKIDDNNQL